MKKIMIATVVTMLIFSVTSFASAASLATGAVSAQGVEIRAGSDTGPMIGKLSAGVRLTADYDATTYAIATAHDKGVKVYATAAGDTKIYTQDKADNAALTNTLTASDTSAFDSGWTEM